MNANEEMLLYLNKGYTFMNTVFVSDISLCGVAVTSVHFMIKCCGFI